MPFGISNLCSNMVPSATLAISEKAKKLQTEGFQVINFGVGEPDFQTPSFIAEAVNEAIKLGMTKYTAVSGTVELKTAIINKLKRENNLEYTAKQVVVSNGAKHSLYNCFQAILNEGDEVIIPTPCWVSYPELVKMAGGIPVFVETFENNNFVPAIDDIKSKVSNKTKAIIINSPSNPNGTIWNKDILLEVGNLALEKEFYIISDEVYEKFVYDDNRHLSIASLSDSIKDITILINAVSKSYSMTGFRIGYTVGPINVIKAMTDYQSQSTSNPNSMAQHAAMVALNSDQKFCDEMCSAFEKRRNMMYKGLNNIPGIKCVKPEGAFYIMLGFKELIGYKLNGVEITDSLSFADLLLKEEMVALVPGGAFMADNHCRLSYAISEKDISEGIKRISSFVNKLTK